MDINHIKKSVQKIKTTLKEVVIMSGVSNEKNKEKCQSILVDLLVDVMDLAHEIDMQAKTIDTHQKKIPKNKKIDMPSSNKDVLKKTKKRIKNPDFDETNPQVIEKEILKVSRRLPVWALNQHQTNAKMLTTYLKLAKKSNQDYVMLDDFANEFPDIKKFKLNLNIMKNISKNNAGKIFDIQQKKVYIWKPVLLFIEEYKKDINLYN